MPDLPPGLVPRGLDRVQAAAYVGCKSVEAFDDWRRRGIVPGPMPGTKVWDRKALDAALDRISGLAAPAEDARRSPWSERLRHVRASRAS